MSVIYHGTPLTPRAALLEVCKGRAMCVSFFRPDDVEAVEAISPAIMFRQWGVLNVEGCAKTRRRVGGKMGLVGLFRLAGASPVSSRSVGGDPRYAGCTVPAQRRTTETVAVRAEGFASLAHGCANRAPASAVRKIRPGFPRMDRGGQTPRQARISRTDARGRSGFGQPLANTSHDARDQGGVRLPLCQRGRNNPSTEWMAL